MFSETAILQCNSIVQSLFKENNNFCFGILLNKRYVPADLNRFTTKPILLDQVQSSFITSFKRLLTMNTACK